MGAFEKIAAVCLAREIKSTSTPSSHVEETGNISIDTSSSVPSTEGEEVEVQTSTAPSSNDQEEGSGPNAVAPPELLTTAEQTPLFVKSCSRQNLAALLVICF